MSHDLPIFAECPIDKSPFFASNSAVQSLSQWPWLFARTSCCFCWVFGWLLEAQMSGGKVDLYLHGWGAQVWTWQIYCKYWYDTILDHFGMQFQAQLALQAIRITPTAWRWTQHFKYLPFTTSWFIVDTSCECMSKYQIDPVGILGPCCKPQIICRLYALKALGGGTGGVGSFTSPRRSLDLDLRFRSGWSKYVLVEACHHLANIHSISLNNVFQPFSWNLFCVSVCQGTNVAEQHRRSSPLRGRTRTSESSPIPVTHRESDKYDKCNK